MMMMLPKKNTPQTDSWTGAGPGVGFPRKSSNVQTNSWTGAGPGAGGGLASGGCAEGGGRPVVLMEILQLFLVGIEQQAIKDVAEAQTALSIEDHA